MNVSLLAICIGNTRVHLATFVDGEVTFRADLTHGELDGLAPVLTEAYAPLADRAAAPVVLASVHPPLTQRLLAALAATLPQVPVRRVESDLPIPIGRQLDPETLVGEDRLLNAAAAFGVLRQACVIVDAGTAITIDFVDGQGTFHGGAIGPGASLMLRSLHEHTAQLPEVDMARPEEAIGHNTAQAMRTAVFHGLRGMVRELVEKYAEVAGAYPMVVATGGDAAMLFEGFDLIDRIVPDLTLRGLALTLQTAAEGPP